MNTVSRPIPISNTQVSKHLRMAAVEAIIAKKLCEKIFQPLHIITFTAKDELERTLDRLYEKRPRQESILRSLLYTAHESDEKAQEKRLVDIVTSDVGELLGPLLFTEADSKLFRDGLEALLGDAVQLWTQVQKSPGKIIASVEGRGWDWDSHEEYENAVSLTAAQKALIPGSEEPVMTLFPRIYSSETSAPFHAGFSLFSDQSVVIAGHCESREQLDRVNSRNAKVVGTGGRRRNSVTNSIKPSSFHQRTQSLPSSTPHPRPESGKFAQGASGGQHQENSARQSVHA